MQTTTGGLIELLNRSADAWIREGNTELANRCIQAAKKLGEELLDAPAEDANDSEEIDRRMKALGFHLWGTGGGCEAYGLNFVGGHSYDEPHLLLTIEDGGEVPTDLDEAVSLGRYGGADGDEGETLFEGTMRDYLNENENWGPRLAALGWREEWQYFQKEVEGGKHLCLSIDGGGGKPRVLDEPILVCVYPNGELEGGVETFTGSLREFLTASEEMGAVLATAGLKERPFHSSRCEDVETPPDELCPDCTDDAIVRHQKEEEDSNETQRR